MNIYAKKLRLIEWITQINDALILEKLLDFQNKTKTDWWDELSEQEKNEIELGLKDMEAGRTVDHSEARKLYEKYL
jgi:hypothetical protein